MLRSSQHNTYYYTLFPIFLLLFITPTSPIIRRSDRVVKLNDGRIQGFVAKPNHRSLGIVEVFLGVPYAAAPVGNLRFMPPMQPFTWSYLRRAETMPPVCPQKLPDVSNRREALKRMPEGRYNYLQRLIPQLRNQSEDCLFLNIYVPFGSKKAAVLVYVHGESYEWNSGNPYDGITLASYGQVIVVTVNFRLGVLGFLRPALSESHVSNFGLLDQIAALHWIKENILEFGGDPYKVTIFGHGTGGALANLLLISPVTQVSKGLFQRAIVMSGSALSKWALTWDPYKYTIQVSKAVGCPLNDRGDELVRCLRSKTVDELLAVRLQTPPFTTPLGPIVDGVIIKTEPFRSMSVDSSDFGRYELLYGVSLAESYNMLNAAEVKFGMTSERKNRLLRAYISNNFDHHASHVYAAVLNEYNPYSSNAQLQDERVIRDETLQILSDAQIVAPVVSMGDLHSELNTKSYFYVFNHQSTYGDYPVAQGTVHGEELAYVFGAPLVGGFSHFPINFTLEEVFLSEFVMTLWTNFAKTGNPNLPTPQGYLTAGANDDWEDNLRVLWPPYEKITQEYLHIDMQVVKNSYYRARKMGFWNRLIPDLVTSSGNIRDPISVEPFPGATYPTITLIPSVKPQYAPPEIFTTPTSHQPQYYHTGLKPIKPVEPYYNKPALVPTRVSPVKQPSSEEAKPEEEASYAGTSITVVVAVGIVILFINCFAMAGIYYQRSKLKREVMQMKDGEAKSCISETSESEPDGLNENLTKDTERKSRKNKRTTDKDKSEGHSDSLSRVSSTSRESSSRRKTSQSQDPPSQVDSVEKVKAERPIMNGHSHRRTKSDHSLYIEIGKEEARNQEKKASKTNKSPSVKFITSFAGLPPKNENRSTSSIVSKTSIKSTTSRTSVKSTSSRASVKNGTYFKPLKKNASCQSLPTASYTWGITKEMTMNRDEPDGGDDNTIIEKEHTASAMPLEIYPPVLPNPNEIESCATLPRARPPPPPRSTSLTTHDLQELEKLHEVYRKTRSPRHPSTDSCEMSGSEPFYSMGGGEAPARAPGLMYVPTLPSALTTRRSCKTEGADFEQYQKYQPQFQHREQTVGEAPPTQLLPGKPYLTYGENRAPRGPLASFGKIDQQHNIMSGDYGMGIISHVLPISPVPPPPVPAHQVPLTPSLLKNQNLPSTPVTAMFDQTENTGTIKRQKPKAYNQAVLDNIEKPLKSVLKTTSAYDKSKRKGVGLNVGLVAATGRADAPSSPQSVSSVSSTSLSLSSGGSGLVSPQDGGKGISIKKSPRANTAVVPSASSAPSTPSSKIRHIENIQSSQMQK